MQEWPCVSATATATSVIGASIFVIAIAVTVTVVYEFAEYGPNGVWAWAEATQVSRTAIHPDSREAFSG